jgi:hypothetical protein
MIKCDDNKHIESGQYDNDVPVRLHMVQRSFHYIDDTSFVHSTFLSELVLVSLAPSLVYALALLLFLDDNHY